MRWFWIYLGRFFDKRNGVNREKNTRIHFTKADKPLGEMSPEERQNLAKKIVEGFLNDGGKKSE